MPNLITQRVAYLGIELEGQWDLRPEGYKGDGSVNFMGDNSGEVASDPLPLGEALEWMQELWPDKRDYSCGMHVHFSVHTAQDYSRLMNKGFWEYFRRYMRLWGRKRFPRQDRGRGTRNDHSDGALFWGRLLGDNDFCRLEHYPDSQIVHRSRGYERYTQLNYCYGIHRTMEVRLLPMFSDVRLAVKAVRALTHCIESYLRRFPATADLLNRHIVLQEPDGTRQDDLEPLVEDCKLETTVLAPWVVGGDVRFFAACNCYRNGAAPLMCCNDVVDPHCRWCNRVFREQRTAGATQEPILLTRYRPNTWATREWIARQQEVEF